MKIGKILGEIAGGVLTIGLIGSAGYSLVAWSAASVQNNFFHDFRGAVQAGVIKLEYTGVEPYAPWLPHPLNDTNGYAEVRLRGNEPVFLRYEDLNVPSLEGKVMVKNSEGEGSEFNDKAEYDAETRKAVEELKRALGSLNSDRSIRDIVEEEIRKAIERR